MEVPLNEIAELIAPLVGAGATGAAQEAGQRAGSRAYGELAAIADKVRSRLSGGDAGPGEVEAALRAAVADGEIAEHSLRRALTEHRTSVHARRNAIVGSTVIGRDISF